jgi:type II secretory pathway pseudopilin PulG
MMQKVSPETPGSVGAAERHYGAFTLIELIVVVGIIVVLTGLILSTVGYVRKKSAFARAQTEIAAMSAACENYKTDSGVYPTDPLTTEQLDARVSVDPSTYQGASLYLYEKLSGDSIGNRTLTGKSYMVFKPNMLFPADQSQNVLYIKDAFGNSYGYSTIQSATQDTAKGYNPTFDLWSTAGVAPSPTPSPPATQQDLWIKNW